MIAWLRQIFYHWHDVHDQIVGDALLDAVGDLSRREAPALQKGNQMVYIVEYVVGPYSGVRRVIAEDEDQALALVKLWAHRNPTLAQAAERYRILERRDQ